MPLVTGQVVFEHEPPHFSKAVLTVKLSDVSIADAPSHVIAIHTRSVGAQDVHNLLFELSPDTSEVTIDPRATYTVSAHISLHPNDNPTEIRHGDYLTTQIYPVLTNGHASTVEVAVKRIS